MPNRFITRMTDIAFHCSLPRGVGMLRLVSSSGDLAIWQLTHRLQDGLQLGIASRCGFENNTALLGLGKRIGPYAEAHLRQHDRSSY